MFSGGRSIKDYAIKLVVLKLHAILNDRYQNEEGFVIAGTSAGAMAMTTEMIAGGSPKEAFIKGAVAMYQGLGS